jgi:hypothetical protein
MLYICYVIPKTFTIKIIVIKNTHDQYLEALKNH